jgi:hypothetical protein
MLYLETAAATRKRWRRHSKKSKYSVIPSIGSSHAVETRRRSIPCMLNEDKHEAGKLSQVDAFGSTVVPINSGDIEEHSPSIHFKDGERPSGPKYEALSCCERTELT